LIAIHGLPCGVVVMATHPEVRVWFQALPDFWEVVGLNSVRSALWVQLRSYLEEK
jgi:hypothetical protein